MMMYVPWQKVLSVLSSYLSELYWSSCKTCILVSYVVSRNEGYGTGFIGEFISHQSSSSKATSTYVMITNYHVMAAAFSPYVDKYTVHIDPKIERLLKDYAKKCQISFVNSTGDRITIDLSQILEDSIVSLSQKVVNRRYGYFYFCCCCCCCCYCYCCY